MGAAILFIAVAKDIILSFSFIFSHMTRKMAAALTGYFWPKSAAKMNFSTTFLMLIIFVSLWCSLVSSAVIFDQADFSFDEQMEEKPIDAPSLHGSHQAWNYIKVRENANIFWWLYYSSSMKGWHNVPLVLWLQGGPGASGTGFGNFEEIGPLNVKLEHRNTTWLSDVNLLFIDNPVGTGYSYVDDKSALCKDIDCIAKDLLFTMKHLLAKEMSKFQNVPFYIFSESYGGKMAAVFSKYLYQAKQEGLPIDFRGVALGDSWIDPVMYVNSWGSYLYSTSLVDRPGFEAISQAAITVQNAVNDHQWSKATSLWSVAENVVANYTNDVNFYNILKWTERNSISVENNIRDQAINELFKRRMSVYMQAGLTTLMNGFIRHKLEIIPDNVTWGGQSADVFAAQSGEFMKPVVDTVDYLLSKTNLSVVVYNGQLDLICDTIGTEAWVQSLTWPGLPDYFKSKRIPLTDHLGATRAFKRSFKKFTFFWILKAGHMIPQDAGEDALAMLQDIIGSS